MAESNCHFDLMRIVYYHYTNQPSSSKIAEITKKTIPAIKNPPIYSPATTCSFLFKQAEIVAARKQAIPKMAHIQEVLQENVSI